MATKATIDRRNKGCRILTFTTSNKAVKYDLREVTQEELMKHRISGVPGVVLKDAEKLYYAEYQRGTSTYIQSLAVKHACGKLGSVCKHLSSASNGGCPKVRDVFISMYSQNASSSVKAVSQAKRIEKYPFIREGIEIFNCSNYMLVVINCTNYENVPSRDTNASDLDAVQKMWNEDDEKRRKEAYARRYEEA